MQTTVDDKSYRSKIKLLINASLKINRVFATELSS